MIELHTWGTPNGRKISIMLEECELPYGVHKIDISKGEQHKPEFLRLSPNNRIPAILDPDGPGGKPYSLFKSGAILIYLADKTKKFLSTRRRQALRLDAVADVADGRLRPDAGTGAPLPARRALKIEYGIKRYVDEAKRLYGVLDKQLAGNAFVAGEDYTIADMSIFPWAARRGWRTVNLADYPNVKRWYDIVNARPAVTKGMAVPYLN